jgi:hypothetical protein
MNLMPSSSGPASTDVGGSKGDGEDVEMAAPVPVVSIAKEKILEEVELREKDEKPVLSLVVVGASVLVSRGARGV